MVKGEFWANVYPFLQSRVVERDGSILLPPLQAMGVRYELTFTKLEKKSQKLIQNFPKLMLIFTSYEEQK